VLLEKVGRNYTIFIEITDSLSRTHVS